PVHTCPSPQENSRIPTAHSPAAVLARPVMTTEVCAVTGGTGSVAQGNPLNCSTWSPPAIQTRPRPTVTASSQPTLGTRPPPQSAAVPVQHQRHCRVPVAADGPHVIRGPGRDGAELVGQRRARGVRRPTARPGRSVPVVGEGPAGQRRSVEDRPDRPAVARGDLGHPVELRSLLSGRVHRPQRHPGGTPPAAAPVLRLR